MRQKPETSAAPYPEFTMARPARTKSATGLALLGDIALPADTYRYFAKLNLFSDAGVKSFFGNLNDLG
jgi:hypothetical protein